MVGSWQGSGRWLGLTVLVLACACIGFPGCGGSDGLPGAPGRDGVDGADGMDGADGADAGNALNVATTDPELLASMPLEYQILSVVTASPPVVTFSIATEAGVPLVGMGPWVESYDRLVRFTLAKLVPTTGGANTSDSWVCYTRDGDGEPTYDSPRGGGTFTEVGGGVYTYTFFTDVTAVPGVLWEPTRTHRLAGQFGGGGFPIQPINFVYDYVPAGGPLPLRRDIAVMETCNQCHDDLVFHGRRFEVEYCVTCHNPDLASGEGDMAYMIHRIHKAGAFNILDDGIDYSELTYPQDPRNCTKCHDEGNAATPQAGNWKTKVNRESCGGCHTVFEDSTHPLVPNPSNDACLSCHAVGGGMEPEVVHVTPNMTPHNQSLLPGQRHLTYELIDASVNATTGDITINFKLLSDGTALDVTNLPDDIDNLGSGTAFPDFLLAWALPQDGIAAPMDFNNIGQRGAQPIAVDLGTLISGANGSVSYASGTGTATAVITNPALLFPAGATLRAIGLQGYFRQDLDGDFAYDVALHTPSAVVTVTGDDARRRVVDNDKCAACHEHFEGHGGNRVYEMMICTFCHNPNQSSSGRTATDPSARGTDAAIAAAVAEGSLDASVDDQDPLTWPEDAQNLKDLIHGVHSEGFRTRHFQHVRGGRQGYYDWSHITFPRGASTASCTLCHLEGTYELPLASGLLATTVRTTGVVDGQDASVAAAEAAFVNVPNTTDWVNTATAGSCFMCHTSSDAQAHMLQNGGLVSDPSVPVGSFYRNRSSLVGNLESCGVCHGAGKTWDVRLVHGLSD